MTERTSRPLSADELLAGASETYRVTIPVELLGRPTKSDGPDGHDDGQNAARSGAGEVEIRPLTVRDVQRIHKAAREQRVLTSVLMVQQALVAPRMTVEQVGSLSAGLVQYLLAEVNRTSGLSLDESDLEQMVKAPLARACFVLAREFGWTPAECSELTVGQVLLYLEMLARGESAEDVLAGHGGAGQEPS